MSGIIIEKILKLYRVDQKTEHNCNYYRIYLIITVIDHYDLKK